MYIDCVGMMRSGSTLQYNIVAEILELKEIGKRLGWEHHEEFYKIKEKYMSDKYNVFKNHFLTDEIEAELKQVDGSMLMYVYRDIRDVCISIMDKENKTFEQVFNSKVLHNAIEQYYKITNSSLKKYIQSYEVMFLNTKREIKEVARFLNVELTTDEIETIYSKISFESQKDNIEKYKENSEYISKGKQKFNADTLLHLNHIKDGGIAKYRQRLSKSQIKQLEDEFGEWLDELGYKVENKQEEQEPLRRYYSQHGEDYLLWKFFDFKKDGFFVEVGAFDGVHLSNTYSFELEGWKGICVEPGQYFENCKKNRPNSICINAACVSSDDIKEITFYEEELGLLSSMDMSTEKKEDIEKRYENRKLNFSGHKEKTVKAQTLNSILEENSVSKINFITIDVEGAEIEVLKGFDLKKYKPKVVILEANDEEHKKEIIDYMTVQNSYVFAREVSVNLVFVSHKDDFNKMKDIEINCTVEKQVHPLGKKYTLQSHFDGKKIGSQADLVFNDELILIYQVGKVGSSSIFQSLKELNLKNQDIFQVHNIALAEELMSKELKKGFHGGKHHFQDGIKVKKLLQNNSYKKIKVIVGVREPIARWISDIFQNINERYAFLRNEYGQVDVEKTIKYIKTTLEDEPFNTWFDSELKSTFGIDVFQYDFSKTKGFEVFSKDNVDFFIYKLEMLNSLEEELKKFLLVNDFKLTIVNESSNKVYDNDYKLVKKFFKVDEEVLIEYYKRSEIAQYFYNDDEIATFIKKWSGNNYNKNQELEEKKKVIQQKNQELEEKKKVIQQKNQELEEKRKVIQQKNQELEEKRKVIQQKNQELEDIYSSKKYKLVNILACPWTLARKLIKG